MIILKIIEFLTFTRIFLFAKKKKNISKLHIPIFMKFKEVVLKKLFFSLSFKGAKLDFRIEDWKHIFWNTFGTRQCCSMRHLSLEWFFLNTLYKRTRATVFYTLSHILCAAFIIGPILINNRYIIGGEPTVVHEIRRTRGDKSDPTAKEQCVYLRSRCTTSCLRHRRCSCQRIIIAGNPLIRQVAGCRESRSRRGKKW